MGELSEEEELVSGSVETIGEEKARMEYYILNDMELSFKDILKRCLEGKPLSNPKDLEEWEAKREARSKTIDSNGDSKNGSNSDVKETKKKTKKRTESGKSIEESSDT